MNCYPEEIVLDSAHPIPAASEASGARLSVAYVVHNFNMGGLERCVARLANKLDRSRFRPLIICLDKNGTAAQWLQADDVPIIELHKKLGNDLGVIRRLANVLKEHSVDVVHSHNWGTLVETTLARKISKTPVHIHAERGMELEAIKTASWKRKLRGRVMRWALERCDCVAAVAEAVREQVIERCGGLDKEIIVIPNGVSRPAVDPSGPTRDDIRAQFQIAPSAAVIGSVGRLAPVKDFPLAVDAIANLRDQGLDVHLLLVGDGPELARLTAHAEQRGVSSYVHFSGRREDVGNWLAAMDVYINCSLNEGMSQSILEAMSAGLPLVVTDVGDSGLLLGKPPEVGSVVPSGDSAALAGAIADILGDDLRRRELGERATQRHQQTYSLAGMIDRYESLYQSLVSGRSASQHKVGSSQPLT